MVKPKMATSAAVSAGARKTVSPMNARSSSDFPRESVAACGPLRSVAVAGSLWLGVAMGFACHARVVCPESSSGRDRTCLLIHVKRICDGRSAGFPLPAVDRDQGTAGVLPAYWQSHPPVIAKVRCYDNANSVSTNRPAGTIAPRPPEYRNVAGNDRAGVGCIRRRR